MQFFLQKKMMYLIKLTDRICLITMRTFLFDRKWP